MSIRDREVLEELRDDPELLAIADAVVETQSLRRRVPFGTLAAVAVAAAALFVLVLASPWDRGGRASVRESALAAVDGKGPVVHLTMKFRAAGKRTFEPLTIESYYDQKRGLLRVISRSEGNTVSDYTTLGAEDEFSLFPGLLEGAAYYRRALASGRAKVTGEGLWEGRSVYWVQLEKGGGPGPIRVGIDRENYRPVVFRIVKRDGSPTGHEIAVLGFDYVSAEQAAFEPDAPVLVSGTVIGRDCRPIRARVSAFLPSSSPAEGEERTSADIASATTGPDGRFTLRVNPAKSPFRELLAKDGSGRLRFELYAIQKDFSEGLGYAGFSRFVDEGQWWGNTKANPVREGVTIRVARDPAPKCD
jgi:hypothetical protein